MENKKIVIPKILYIIPTFFLGISIIILIAVNIVANLNEANPIRIAGNASASTTLLSGISNAKYNEWIFSSTDRSTFDLLNDSEVDGAIISLFDLANFNQRGIELTMVGLFNCPLNAHQLIGKNEIQSIGDLVEKKIGVPEVNSPGHFFVLQVLRQGGISEGDVGIETILKGSPFDAITNNVVDAAYAGPQALDQSTAGFKILATNEKLPLLGCDGLAIKNDLLKTKKRAIEKTLQSYFEFIEDESSTKWQSLKNENWPTEMKSHLDKIDKIRFLTEEQNEDSTTGTNEQQNVNVLLDAINDFAAAGGENSKVHQKQFTDRYF